MIDDLIAFLRARYDDEEQKARVASAGGGEWTDRLVPGTVFNRDRDTLVDDFPDQAPHIARWDPARVLAEVDAKRRILDRCEAAFEESVQMPHCETRAADSDTLAYVVRLLALPFADHPDYREEWRPAE